MEETQEKNDKPLKIAILGYNKVGKSSLISALTKNKTNVIFKQTKDIEKYSEEIKIEEKNYKLDILDTIYKGTLANYKDKDFGDIDKSEGYILVYSIDEIKTYKITKVIYQEIIKIKNFLKADIIGESSIIFVGNKNDLKVENDFSKEVKEFCSANKIKHIQTNTVNGNNVQEVFESVVKGILYNRQNRKNDVEENLEELEELEDEEEEEEDDEEDGNLEKGRLQKGDIIKKENSEQALDLDKLLEELQRKKEENNDNKEKEIKEEDSIEKEKNEEKSNKIGKKEKEEKEEEEKNEIKGDCGCCILF